MKNKNPFGITFRSLINSTVPAWFFNFIAVGSNPLCDLLKPLNSPSPSSSHRFFCSPVSVHFDMRILYVFHHGVYVCFRIYPCTSNNYDVFLVFLCAWMFVPSVIFVLSSSVRFEIIFVFDFLFLVCHRCTWKSSWARKPTTGHAPSFSTAARDLLRRTSPLPSRCVPHGHVTHMTVTTTVSTSIAVNFAAHFLR